MSYINFGTSPDCPFCGGTPHLKSKTVIIHAAPKNKYYIICSNCKAKSAEADYPLDAWALWNRRIQKAAPKYPVRSDAE